MLLLDTGPLVGYLNARDEHHEWAVNALKELRSSLVTCEAVLTEAFYLLSNSEAGPRRLVEFCNSGVLQIDFRLLDEVERVGDLLRKYRNIPMDLADGCLVHMA